MSKRKAQDLIYGNNYEKYNTLKQQLERQTQNLLKQRQKIQKISGSYVPFPSKNTIIQNNQLQYDQEQEDQQNFQVPHFQMSEKHHPVPQKKSLREQINLRGQTLSDDIMEMIEQIQNKALIQIENLRRDKITLLKKLNQQVKSHNNQKIKRLGYEKKTNSLSKQLQTSKARSQQRLDRNIPNTIYQQENQNSPSPKASFLNSRGHDQPLELENEGQYYEQQVEQAYQPARQTVKSEPAQLKYAHRNTQQPFQYQNPQQRFQQTAPSRKPIQFNSHNVVPSQSYYYVGNNPQSVNPNQGLQNQVNRIRQQNIEMRNTLTRHNSQTALAPNKNSLLNQIKQLSGRANYYEKLIAKTRSNQSTNQRVDEIETLLLQGANLAQNGQKLMKAKSNPEFRGSIQVQNINPYRNSRAQFTQVQSNTRIERQIDTPQSYSKQVRMNQNSSKFSPGAYQTLIENMKRAAYS